MPLSLANRAADYGVVIDAPVRVDFARVMERARTVTRNARTGLEDWLAGLDNLTLIQGHARFNRAGHAARRRHAPDRIAHLP
jgi:pyruvate/2-oxoglutarate dehydrogenase complex dihydrolipoamide dehydrogenase (E3) component